MPTLSSNRAYAGKTAVIIGGGVIGASWAALFLVNGLKVIVSDPDPEIAVKVRALIAAALPALKTLGYSEPDVEGNLSFERNNARAVALADVVQECGPEKVEFKQALWKTIETAAPREALLFSSSSTIPASVQDAQMVDRSRLVIGHPFNPPHLMPLVEVVPTPTTDPAITARALDFYRGVGKVALEIRKEVPGFVANRLQAAIFQEAVFLVAEGVVSLQQLDDVVTSSLGIRWATSGPFLSFHLGGGPGGFAHFLEHLGPPMELAWKHLGKASLDDATKTLLVKQLGASYGASSFYALSEVRDDREVAVINGLDQVPDRA
ncbi:hydroxylacyl-CoA dehydrogenase (plasmid) [Burkholderia sp. PAMC 28687]|uniref:3-hydroxyacyl-CoA dehydrogenase NAD-binding domain-containing protein n=1 Tax=Burkholderia sp. PAMC 28687 TaxID=1795874 RepID=UPI0007841FFD|nr:3-hydroxyacyl-CoA dehydrogenase NAD-binding domain-containing protein [Burkholderia sp. PAMC 28687]AMM18733.1 hydroxylacyl-CoA dehydrogenase [Burkholderia sp. PAMC 28687]